MTLAQLLEEIEKSRAIHSSLFTMYINVDDPESQASYKRMMTNQNKSTEELIKLYRRAKHEEFADHEEKRWAERDAALSASSRGDRHKDFVDEDEE